MLKVTEQVRAETGPDTGLPAQHRLLAARACMGLGDGVHLGKDLPDFPPTSLRAWWLLTEGRPASRVQRAPLVTEEQAALPTDPRRACFHLFAGKRL